MTFPPLSQPNGTRSDNARDRIPQALVALTVRNSRYIFFTSMICYLFDRVQLSYFLQNQANATRE